jgi:hypothetical protein
MLSIDNPSITLIFIDAKRSIREFGSLKGHKEANWYAFSAFQEFFDPTDV